MSGQIPILFPQIYTAFGIETYAAQLALQLLVFIGLIAVFIRIVLCAAYQNIYMVYTLQAKGIGRKIDIEKIKHGLFYKAVKAYVPILEKGIHYIPAKDIVEKEFGRAGFWFFNFRSAGALVTAFENGILLIGVILAVIFAEEAAATAVAGIALFAAVKIFAMIFDYDTLKEKSAVAMTIYIETEIGQFYAKDAVSSVNLLRIEIKNAMRAQSDAFKESIDLFCKDLVRAMEKTMVTASGSIEATMRTVLESASALEEPLEKWQGILAETSASQARLRDTINGIDQTLGGVVKLSDFAAKNEAIEQQIQFMKTNQQSLAVSLQQYELTLKAMTAQIGEGIGKIIEFHTQEAYHTINAELQENIQPILNANNELIVRLQRLFEQIQEQSRSETNAIIGIKEQMELYFNSDKAGSDNV